MHKDQLMKKSRRCHIIEDTIDQFDTLFIGQRIIIIQRIQVIPGGRLM